MLGIKSSGCFIIGIFTGFLVALFLGMMFIFFFNPEIKQKTLLRVEDIWRKVKNNVDDSLDAAKNSPTIEPAVFTNFPSLSGKEEKEKEKSPAPQQSRSETESKKMENQTAPVIKPKIEIKLGI